MTSPDSAVAVRTPQQPAALQDPQLVSALDAMLPTPAARQRFLRVAAQAFTREPKLRDCTPASIALALVDALTWGLEPSGRVGGAYLVPFRDRDRNVLEAVMIPDYRGLIQIITKPGSPVTAIAATLVHEGDDLTGYREGVDGFVDHRPSLASNRSLKPTTHAYAVASLATGERIVRVIDRSYAEKIRARVKSARSPWNTDFDAMFRKTAIKALANNLPIAREIREVIARDDVIDGEAHEQPAIAEPAGPTRTAQLGQRLRSQSTSSAAATDAPSSDGDSDGSPAAAEQPIEGEAREVEPPHPAEPERPRPDPSRPGPMKGDPCPRHLDVRLSGGDRGPADLYHSLGRGQGYCRPYADERP